MKSMHSASVSRTRSAQRCAASRAPGTPTLAAAVEALNSLLASRNFEHKSTTVGPLQTTGVHHREPYLSVNDTAAHSKLMDSLSTRAYPP
jgi:hypothetical protein